MVSGKPVAQIPARDGLQPLYVGCIQLLESPSGVHLHRGHIRPNHQPTNPTSESLGQWRWQEGFHRSFHRLSPAGKPYIQHAR